MDEITQEMLKAGQDAEYQWLIGGQNGPLPRVIYLAMREASGVDDAMLDAEQLNFTAEHLAAGAAADNGLGNKHAAIYQAIRSVPWQMTVKREGPAGAGSVGA